MNLYYEMGLEHFQQESFFDALEQFQNALVKAESLEDTDFILDCTYQVGASHHRLNNYQLALDYFFQYLNNGGDDLDAGDKGNALNAIAAIFKSLGEFNKAYDYQTQALELQESIKDSVGIIKALYDIGTIFYYQNDLKRALKYYEKVMNMAIKIGHDKMIYNAYGALGSTHNYLQHIDTAMYYSLKSLEKAIALDYKTGIAYAYQNLGATHLESKNYREALDYFEQSYQISVKSGDRWLQTGALIALADTYNQFKKYGHALEKLDQALEIAKELDAKSKILDIYNYYAETFEKLEQPEKAIEYLQFFIAMKDSVINETTIREMGERKNQYEIQKRENEISLLKTESELLKKDKEIQSLTNYLAAGSVLFLLMMVGLFAYRYKEQRHSNTLLRQKNDKIQTQNEQIQIQNKQLETSNLELENFAYVASHDLKEPLRMVKSYTDLLKRRYNNLFDEDANEFMFFIADGVKRMESLVNDLLMYSRVGRKELELEAVSTQAVVASIANTLQPNVQEKSAKLEIHYDRLPQVQGNKTQISQLFLNLMSNALKFQANGNPTVTIDCKKNGKYYIFKVQDNGIGISPENHEKIFEMFRRLHTRTEFDGTGIGLATCKKIVDNHGGKIWVESEEGSGSSFFFTLPY